MSTRIRAIASLAFWIASSLSADLSHAQDSFPPVEVAAVVEAEVNTASRVVGSVRPRRTSTIGSAVAGRVLEFYAKAGEQVEAGAPLAQLRTETLQIELAAAEAELELYKQQFAEIRNGSRPEDIAEAAANASGAEAAMVNANNQLQRMQELSRTGAATTADLEDARERAKFTKFAYAASQAQLKRVEEGPRIEQAAQAQARVDLQSQNVRIIEDRIQKHTLIAPFDGYISEEYTEIGAWINAGDAVAQVIELNEVEVVAPVTADHVSRLRRGEQVRIEFPEMPEKLLSGEIAQIVPVADPRARTFPVIVRMENEVIEGIPLLMSGMLVRVDLPSGKRQTLPIVPKDALVLNERQHAVFVVEKIDNANVGTVRRVPVQLGVAVEDRIQVTGDLRADQLVVVVGNERLVPGSKVTVSRVVDPRTASR